MICKEEGVSTSRFCGLFEIPERTWRRWQAKARQASRVKGPWPQPVRDEVRLVVGEHALQHPVWGHRRIWALARHDGYRVCEATVLRALRDEELLQSAGC